MEKPAIPEMHSLKSGLEASLEQNLWLIIAYSKEAFSSKIFSVVTNKTHHKCMPLGSVVFRELYKQGVKNNF